MMEILLLLAISCLIVFMVLASFDGAYLHIWKYELFNHEESLFEHQTHTLRAILFPLIVWLFFIQTDIMSFWAGLFLVGMDLIVLGVDAYAEKDSRSFMNGLPRWEYIIHLFANSFHFASIVLMIAVRLEFSGAGIMYSDTFYVGNSFETVQLIAVNILPGAILLAIIHLILVFDVGKHFWNRNRASISCC